MVKAPVKKNKINSTKNATDSSKTSTVKSASNGKIQLKKNKKQVKAKNIQKKQADVIQCKIVLPPKRFSDELVQSQNSKWINKQRVLVTATRGITFRDRHLMNNLKTLFPHSKSEPKMESKNPNLVLNEVCEVRNCNKCIFFENRKRQDLYMWIANVPNGPTAKFLVENVHTMEELRMSGNCLKASRPFLSFDPRFDSEPHYALLKELLAQVFGTPNGHPKSQPFFDHVFTFTILDHRIWFRNYQLVDENGSLAEVGPRFDLNLIKIFDGSFGGRILYTNPHYVAPNKHRILVKQSAAAKYRDRIEAKKARQLSKPSNDQVYADLDKYDDVFQTIRPEEAVGAEKKVFKRVKK